MKVPNIIIMDLKEYQFAEMKRKEAEKSARRLQKELAKEKVLHQRTQHKLAEYVGKYLFEQIGWYKDQKFEDGKLVNSLKINEEIFENIMKDVPLKLHSLVIEEYEKLRNERE